MADDLRQAFAQLMTTIARAGTYFARLGDGSSHLHIEGRTGFIWARVKLPEGETLRQVRCRDVSAIYDLPVLVRRNVVDSELEVVSEDPTLGPAFMGGYGSPNVGPHGSSHFFNGADPVWLSARQLFEFRVEPAIPPSLSLTVGPYLYRFNGVWTAYLGGTVDLSSYVPGAPQTQRLVILGLLGSTHTLAVVAGDVVVVIDASSTSIPFTGTHIAAALAAAPVDFIPTAAVRLRGASSSIQKYEIFASAKEIAGHAEGFYHNYSATTDPTTSDDNVTGYAAGCLWFNVSSSRVFQCLDATVGAAVWVELTGSGAAGDVDVDLPPSSPSAYDDEFDDASFNTSLWTEYDTGSKQTVAESSGVLALSMASQASDVLTGVRQTLPAGDFTLAIKVKTTLDSAGDGQHFFAGLLLWENAADDSANIFGWGIGAFGAGVNSYAGYLQTLWTANTTLGTLSSGNEGLTAGAYHYIRLRRSGTAYFIDASLDGKTWQVTTALPGFTPTHFGVGIFNKGTGSSLTGSFDFFRYRAQADSASDPVYGRISGFALVGHTHDAADITYTPAVPADWTGGVDPGAAADAFDQLADRVTDLEAGGGGGLDSVYNILDYGAVGDGTTDDHAAIQSAIDAMEAAGGGTVFFPGGNVYRLSTGLVHDADVRSAFSGYGAQLKPDNNVAALEVNQGAGGTIKGCSIRGLEIVGASTTGTTGILLHNTDRTTIIDVRITGCNYGVHFYSTSSLWVEECGIFNSAITGCNTGVYFEKHASGTGSFSETVLCNVGIIDCANGISLGSGSTIYRSHLLGVTVWLPTNGYGFYIDGDMTDVWGFIAFEEIGQSNTTAFSIGSNSLNTDLCTIVTSFTGSITHKLTKSGTQPFSYHEKGHIYLSGDIRALATRAVGDGYNRFEIGYEFSGGGGLLLGAGSGSPDVSLYRKAANVLATDDALVLGIYTEGTKPAAATAGAGALIYVSDASAGQKFQASNGSAWVYLDGGGGATAFTSLSDVPASYSGQGGKAVRVNSGATALEFADFPTAAPTGPNIGVRVYHNANQTISSGGDWKILTWNSERFDTNGFHSTSSNTSRLTVPTGYAGYYLIGAHAQWSNQNGGERDLVVLLNGTTEIARDIQSNVASGNGHVQSIYTVHYLADGDYVEIRVYQSSGNNVDIAYWGNWTPEFFMYRMASGTADMSKSVYDTNNDGVVDNSSALEGHAASYFATASHNHAAADVTSGVFDNARINWAAPAAIGSGTPAAGTFTALTGTTLAVNSASTSTVTAIVKATGSQTADLMQWQNSSGTVLASVLASGSAGFGAAALTTASLYGKRLPAVLSGTEYALIGEMRPNPSGSSSATFIGLRGVAQTITANSNNITGAITGVSAQTSHIAAGIVTTAYGGTYQVSNSGSGEITTAIAANFNVNNAGAGKIVTGCGVSVAVIESSGEITNAIGILINDIINAGTNIALQTNAGLVVFNEGGDPNTDIRIEGDTDFALLFTDASVDMIGIGNNDPAVKLDINADSIRIRTAKTPASAGAAGVAGQFAWDATYFYICIAANTWHRVAHASW